MNWKMIQRTLTGWLMLLTVAGAAEPQKCPFYAYCMEVSDAKQRTLQEQAEMLKELGYDGCGHLWLDGIAERLKTLDAAGLKLFLAYIRVDLAPGAKQPWDPRLKDVLPLLEGRDTVLAVMVEGGNPSDESLDPHAVEVVRELAAVAAPHGVRVALYPHAETWLERMEDAIRLAKKMDRPNVGVMFNLCHWLRTSKDRNYRPLLEQAEPLLFAVSINGADDFDEQPGFGRYIQPLDRGSFDAGRFLDALRQCGYDGPIGLQCYGIPGDARDHLARSIVAWRKLRQTVTKAKVIVAFGDSTTAPRGELTVYAMLLERAFSAKGISVKVVNAGVGGNTTADARARLERDVLAHKPGLAIIQFGINDAAVNVWKDPPATQPDVSPKEYEENLCYFVETLKGRGTEVVLMTPNPCRWTPAMLKAYGKPPYRPDDPDGFNVVLRTYADIVRRLAEQEHVTLIDVYGAFGAYGKEPGQSVDDLLLDGMHPNAAGHQLIAAMLLAKQHDITP